VGARLPDLSSERPQGRAMGGTAPGGPDRISTFQVPITRPADRRRPRTRPGPAPNNPLALPRRSHPSRPTRTEYVRNFRAVLTGTRQQRPSGARPVPVVGPSGHQVDTRPTPVGVNDGTCVYPSPGPWRCAAAAASPTEHDVIVRRQTLKKVDSRHAKAMQTIGEGA
jgi:hypothetical protein